MAQPKCVPGYGYRTRVTESEGVLVGALALPWAFAGLLSAASRLHAPPGALRCKLSMLRAGYMRTALCGWEVGTPAPWELPGGRPLALPMRALLPTASRLPAPGLLFFVYLVSVVAAQTAISLVIW